MEKDNKEILAETLFLKLKSIENKLSVGLDIGGSLAKMAVIVNKQENKIIETIRSFKLFEEINSDNNEIIFLVKCNTPDKVPDKANEGNEGFPTLIKLSKLFEIKTIYATGGGSVKFSKFFEQKYNIKLERYDELLSLVNGYLYLNRYSPFYKVENGSEIVKVPSSDLKFPHMVVNVGSGVSILEVPDLNFNNVKRITGTLLGGGTLIGLAKLMIGVDSYNQILEMANKGDNTKVDLTIKDAYGQHREGYYDVPMSENDNNFIASSFGKIHEFINMNKKNKFTNEDLALAILNMICAQITQLAVIHARRLKIKQVLFFGSFTRRNSFAVLWLDKCMKSWNYNGDVRFNYYDGYLGAIGSLVEQHKNQ